MENKNIKLKVAGAVNEDVNKGIIRIDSSFMAQIGVLEGDVVEIIGNRTTLAIVQKAYPGDLGLNIIRMDGITRRNAKVTLGEFVQLTKTEVKPAKKITIAPAKKGIHIRASPNVFKRGFLGRPIMKGDFISLSGRRRTLHAQPGSPMEEFLTRLNGSMGSFGFSDILFNIVSSSPSKTPLIITSETEIELNPEAVEVKDSETEFMISYEDIGGLKDEISKIREMVELPLKHPELFERLGIEPPKGVLLHGPPGTGKTLLAKAVASETNSHFILINGPEIMCVTGDTPILTKKGFINAKKLYERGGSIENINGYSVKTLKKPISNYAFKEKCVSSKITHVTKLKAEGYEIEFKDGSKLTTSENQPFLVYRNNGLTWEPLKNILPGEYVLKINSISLPEKSYKIPLIKNLVKKNEMYALKSKNLSRSNFIKIPKKTNPDLLEILGLIVSDGNISKKGDSIGFYNQDAVLIKRFKDLIKKVFGITDFKEKNNGKNLGVIVYSKLIVEIIKELGFTANSKVIIPPYFINLPKEEIKSFVRGYFDGDGSVAKLKINNLEYPTPIIYAKDEKFLYQLQSLLSLKLKIKTHLKKHKTKKGLMHKLIIRGFDGRKKFLNIKPKSGEKLKRLNEINKVKRIKEHENIPHPLNIIKKIRTLPYKKYRNKDYYVYKTGNATKHSLKVLYDIAKKNRILDKSINDEFNLLMRDDISWEKVEKINKKGKIELYDFTVNDDSFIVAPYFVLHNSKFYGESENNLRKKFEEAEKNSPSIIFIDEIDAIATKREETKGEVEKRVVAQLLSLMDGLKSRGKTIVIAASNIPNSLDPALRRPGRFDREIEIGPPNQEGRLEVLKVHTRNMPLDKSVKLKKLARITHGFVGADLSALAKESAMVVLRRVMPDLNLNEDNPIPPEILDKLKVNHEDFMEALKVVRPSAMREVLVEIPNVTWKNIGGLDDVKEQLEESVEWPLNRPKKFKEFGIQPPKGVLLFGPPGTGKTLLAKAVANQTEANFILINGPSLLSKWVGESEKAIREVFRKARQSSPTVIFFDEIDAIAPRRGRGQENNVTERVVNQLLTEMDGLEETKGLVVIAATNRPDIVDPALLRPGRFDRVILCGVPDKKTREKIFEVHTRGIPLESNVNLGKLADETEGYVGADIESVCREAAMNVIRKGKKKKVAMSDFKEALKIVKGSVTKKAEDNYKKIKSKIKRSNSEEMNPEPAPNYFG